METSQQTGLRRGACGAGKYGFLVLVLFTVSFIFVAFRLIPVYFERAEFEEDLQRIADRAALHGWSDQLIEQQVLVLAQVRTFQFSPGEVRITRSSLDQGAGELSLEVTYRRAVQFPGYIHTFEFRSTVLGSW